jgi:hypothetical protein
MRSFLSKTLVTNIVVALLLPEMPAQGNQMSVHAQSRREVDAWSVSAAYFGETFLHPGAAIEVERKLKFWGRRYGLVEHGFFTEADLGTYWHARNAIGVFVSADFGYRLVFPKGFRLEWLVGLGYLHTLDDGKVYTVGASSDQVTTVDDTGQSALMLSALIGIGWDFSVATRAPFALFLRAGLFGQYPYNTAVLPHLEAQLGISIPLERVVHKGGV